MTALGLAFAAGVAFAVQNLLLAAMLERGLGYHTALALNSAVGFALLAALNLTLHGPAFGGAVAQAWRVWFVVPGLLGTFAVFALLFGYANAGAAAPTVALIAGQVAAAVVIDQVRAPAPDAERAAMTAAGAALVVLGAALVVIARR